MGSEKEKMLNGELYDADDPELVAERKRARERLIRSCVTNFSSVGEDRRFGSRNPSSVSWVRKELRTTV